jgi:trans-aconitate 2-methyltransferase
MKWDPAQYGRYSHERSRPFFDLVGQVTAIEPARVVDLGCGPGELTASLAQRWPRAAVAGIDSSPEMISQAAQHGGAPVDFTLGHAEDFSASGVDVLISNALLQWVPTHCELLNQWAAELNPDGWLAFQVPANFSAPSHQLMRDVAGSPRWRDQLAGVLRLHDAVGTPAEYLDLLVTAGLSVNAWQTNYLHILTGPDPVLEWVKGTGLRPILQVLSAVEADEFSAEYKAKLKAAYPEYPYGTVLSYRRTFVVAHK